MTAPSPAAPTADVAPAPGGGTAAMAPPPAVGEVIEFGGAPVQADGNYFALPIITPSDESGRLMIYSVSMRLQTSEIMQGWSLINSAVDEMGGHFPHRVFHGDDTRQAPSGSRQAYFLFRLPTENLAQFIVLVGDNFNIWRLDILAEDETATYQQRDSALQDLLDHEAFLMEMIGSADDPDEVRDLQERLFQVRGQIAGLGAAQAQLMEDVIYSTFVIELFEAFPPNHVETVPLTHIERLGQTTSAIVQGALVFATAVLPVILALLLVAAIALVIVRIVNKLRRSQKLAKFLSAEQPSGQESDE